MEIDVKCSETESNGGKRSFKNFIDKQAVSRSMRNALLYVLCQNKLKECTSRHEKFGVWAYIKDTERLETLRVNYSKPERNVWNGSFKNL